MCVVSTPHHPKLLTYHTPNLKGATHLKVVWCCFVAEDVHKEGPAWPEPGADAAHELSIVLHVLKHLNRHDTVIRAGSLRADNISQQQNGTHTQAQRGIWLQTLSLVLTQFTTRSYVLGRLQADSRVEHRHSAVVTISPLWGHTQLPCLTTRHGDTCMAPASRRYSHNSHLAPSTHLAGVYTVAQHMDPHHIYVILSPAPPPAQIVNSHS